MSHSPEETRTIAAQFTRDLPPQATVGLSGPLGAGKTVFVQGMAEGLGIDPDAYVRSPTFALIHEYDGKLSHFDLYRLQNFDELLDIGFEDYAHAPKICVLEWADRFEELEPYLTHRIEIVIVDSEQRQIRITPIS